MPRTDRLLVISWFLLLLVGLIGVVAPLLPGSILSLAWLILIHRSWAYEIPTTWLVVFALLVVIANIIDYYLPIRGTKKYGWTKAWTNGSILGMVAGIFLFPPLGMIIGPFVGAFVGEYLAVEGTGDKAIRSARGAFVGFLLTTGFKIILGWWMLVYAIQLVWK